MFVCLSIFNSEKTFRVLGGHPYQSGDPHPEDGAGSSERDGSTHAGDITSANGCCEGRHQRPKMGDIAFSLSLLGES